jgi:hypothetical protein
MRYLIIILFASSLFAQKVDYRTCDTLLTPSEYDAFFAIKNLSLHEWKLILTDQRIFLQEAKRSVDRLKQLGLDSETREYLHLSDSLTRENVAQVERLLNKRNKYWTKNKVGFYISTTAYSLLEGLNEGLQIKEKLESDPAKRLAYSQMWHRLKWTETVSGFSAGFSIALDSDYYEAFDSWKKFFHCNLKALSDLTVSAAIHWIVHDEVIYALIDPDMSARPWYFYTSNWARSGKNGITSDKIANPFTKLGFLAGTIIINYIFYTTL